MSTWLKVADLVPHARRGRPPVLIGFVGPYRLLVVERHEPGMGEPGQPCSWPGETRAPEGQPPAQDRGRQG